MNTESKNEYSKQKFKIKNECEIKNQNQNQKLISNQHIVHSIEN